VYNLKLLKKTLIEEPTIELLELFDKVSEEARIEKNAVPPINKIMYYWTRKPLIVGRVVTLASTLDNIEDVKSLLHLEREKRAYAYTLDVGIYKQKLGRDPSEIKVLDPFGGAGNLIYEAKNLGLDCTISDYNPVAHLIEKAVLEYPAKYSEKLAEDFEKYANEAIEMTKKEVGHFFNSNELVNLWCWCIQCPHCEQRIPLTNQMYITKTPKKKIGIRFHITKDKNFTTELVENMTAEEGKQYTQKGGKAICISCKNTVDYKRMTNDIATRKDREMIVTQIQKKNVREYRLANDGDKKLHENAVTYFNSIKTDLQKQNLIPLKNILPARRRESELWHYNIHTWDKYFDERQLLVNFTFVKNINNVLKSIEDKTYQKTLAVYFSLLLNKRVNMSAFGIVWHVSAQSPQHALTMRTPRIIYNFAESNPFESVGGSFSNNLNTIKNAIKFSTKLNYTTICRLESVTKTNDKKYDLIITDPPYGDDVQYGELSEFFYIWTHMCLKNYYPELPEKIQLDEDFCEAWGRFGDKKIAAEFFEKGLKKSFVSLNEKLKDNGLLVVFFAHSTIKAWNQLLTSVNHANFQVISSFSIHTESTGNVIARGKTSFLSSVIIVCRKLTEQKTAYFEDIIPQTEDNVKEMIDKITPEKLLTIPITDLLIMVYGKVLETCTQFTELKSYEKDFTPDFETLISGSQDFIMRELVAKLTGRNMNLIGAEMAFYLLVRIFFRGKMAADDAIKITRAITVDLNKLQKEQIITNVGGVTNLVPLQEVKLELKPEELDSANLYQQMAHLVHLCHTQGVSKVSSTLSQSGSNLKVDELKKIIPLLIKSYRLQINKNVKLDDSEQEELKILETISDIWGGTEIEGSLDKFIGK